MRLVAALSLLLFFRCAVAIEGQVLSSSRDTLLPQSLIKSIEDEYLQRFRDLHKDSPLMDHEIKASMLRELLQIRVWLEPRSGRAVSERIQFAPPLGGGVIDLSEAISSELGRFGLGMELALPDGVQTADVRVFYLSGAHRRLIDGVEFGAGCGRFMDLTQFWRERWQSQEISLYSKDRRYLSVVAGTYIFSVIQPPKVYLSSLTLTNSQYPQLLCTHISTLGH